MTKIVYLRTHVEGTARLQAIFRIKITNMSEIRKKKSESLIKLSQITQSVQNTLIGTRNRFQNLLLFEKRRFCSVIPKQCIAFVSSCLK